MTKTQPKTKYPQYESYKDSGVEWLGEIPEVWEVKKLKYLCTKSVEYGLNISSEYYSDEGVRFLRTTDFSENGQLKEEGVIIPNEYADQQLLQKGDILISRSGTIGRTYLHDDMEESATFASYLVRFVPSKVDVLSKYIFYFLQSHNFDEWMETQLVSSTISNVNGQKFANVLLPIPPKETQEHVANFLDEKTKKIDSLVNKNEKLIERLKEYRQSLISKAVTKGLDPNAKMKDSGIEWLGEIPEGWKVMRFKDTIESHRNGEWGNEPQEDENDIVCVRVADFDYFNLCVDDTKLTIRNVSEQKRSKLSLNKGDLLIEKSGGGDKQPVGRVVSYNLDKSAIHTNFIEHLKISLNHSSGFLVYVCSYLYSVGLTETSIKQTTGIQNLDLYSYITKKIPLPSKEKQEKIAKYLDKKTEKIDDTINKIQHQIELLKEHRQSLISSAVTGEIKV